MTSFLLSTKSDEVSAQTSYHYQYGQVIFDSEKPLYPSGNRFSSCSRTTNQSMGELSSSISESDNEIIPVPSMSPEPCMQHGSSGQTTLTSSPILTKIFLGIRPRLRR